jgi:O-antigen ligase
MKGTPYSLLQVESKFSCICSIGAQLSLVALFTFPMLPLQVPNIIFMLFALFSIAQWIINGKPSIWKKLGISFIITIPFIPYLIEYLFFHNYPTVGFEMEKKFLFFIAPLIFAFYTSTSKLLNFRVYIRTFAISIILLSAYTLIHLITSDILFTTSFYAGDSSTLRIKFEDISHLHPTYFGFFATISILWILYDFKNLSNSLKWFFGVSGIVMAFLNFLVASKMPLFILILGSFFLLYKITVKKKHLLVTYAAMLVSFVLLLLIIPSLRERMFEMKDIMATNYTDNNSVLERKVIFASSMNLFKSYFWFGLGCRNTQAALNLSYAAIHFLPGVIKQYNSHNQFLTLGISYGVFDVLFFISSVLFVFYKQRRSAFAFVLIASICLTMLTESILERQMGVYFYVLFMLIFINGVSVLFKQEGYQPEQTLP